MITYLLHSSIKTFKWASYITQLGDVNYMPERVTIAIDAENGCKIFDFRINYPNYKSQWEYNETKTVFFTKQN